MAGICPHCEEEVEPLVIEKFARQTDYLLVLCPNCMKILGVLQDDRY